MSAGLLRKGLELLGSEPTGTLSGLKIKKGNNPKAVLSSNKTGMKKQRRRLTRQGKPQNQRASAKNRVIKSVVDEYKKQAAEDHLTANINYLIRAQGSAEKPSCSKIVTQHYGRKAKDLRVKKEKKVQEKPVFTDQDFQKFQEEYFGSR